MPVCALADCMGDEPMVAGLDRGHDCCPKPCGVPVTPSNGCDDGTCVMHTGDAPAEPAAGTKISIASPAASTAPALPVAGTVDRALPSRSDAGDTHYLTLSRPLHILISQYLI